MKAIVTKESLTLMIQQADQVKRGHIIGRALLVLFRRQTAAEQRSNTTNNDNGIGFASCDAKQGSIGAKTYMKHGHLFDHQIEYWTKTTKGSYRICKYHRQLNEAAIERQTHPQGRLV